MDSSVVVKLCRQLQSLAKLFRFVELCILLTFLSWLSTRLPFAVKISGEYFRKLISLIFCPISIFLLGNAIVLTLLTKSGLFSGESPPSIDNAVAELYEEFQSQNPDEFPLSLKKEEEVVFQDKQIICEENTSTATSSKVKIEEKNNEEIVVFPEEIKTEKAAMSYRRSKSENKSSEVSKEKEEKLRRSETDIYWRGRFSDEEGSGVCAVNDENMSNEEFRRTIEAFIAKQVRFHREERLSVVLHGQA